MGRAENIRNMSDEALLIRWQEVLEESLMFIDRGLRGPRRRRKSDLCVAKQRMETWKKFCAEIERRKALFTGR